MELRLAILGGVIPAVILGLLMLVGGWILRTARHAPAEGDATPRLTSHAIAALPTILWLAGFVLAAGLIHFASWSWPRVWPVDATYRFMHSAFVLSVWGVVEAALGRVGASRPRLIETCRWIGRSLVVAAVLGVLGHAYLPSIGWATLVSVVAAGVALTLLAVATMSNAHQHHQPAIAWGVQFLAALGAVGVLILGRTATAAQASAGLAALAAATAVGALIVRRATPGPAASLAWAAMLAWLLMVGCVATGKANLASSALILAAPWALAIPKKWLDIDLFWKRVPVTRVIALAWAVICVAAAITLAVVTQEPEPEPYAY